MSDSISSYVALSSSWQVENHRTLDETLTVTKLGEQECDLEKIVNYETCVHLLARNDKLCELKFKNKLSTTHNLQIAQIAIVSEARILELYGNCGEYIETIHADFIDEFEDMSVYMAVLRLKDPASECLIKLLRPKNHNQIWIYGINVALDKVRQKVEMSVNFENVNRILKESGHQLTEKAEKCKKFLQMYGSVLDPSKMPNKPPDPQVLMKMLESAYLPHSHPFKQQTKAVSQCLTDLLPGIGTLSKPKDSSSETIDFTTNKYPKTATCEDQSLLLHIDQCFYALEKKLDEKLNAMEDRLNVRLDKILLQLENLQDVKKNTEIS